MLLHHILLHYIIKYCGTGSPILLTFISVFGYLVSIYWVFRVGRLVANCRLGLIASGLFLLNTTIINYATDIRSYSLAILLGLIATESYIKVTRDYHVDTKFMTCFWSLIYMLSATLGVFTHFTFASILLSHILHAIIKVRSRSTWLLLIFAGTGTILCVTVWLYYGGGMQAISGYRVVTDYFKWEDSQDGEYARFGVYNKKNVVAATVNTLQSMAGNRLSDRFSLQVRSLALLVLIPLGLWFLGAFPLRLSNSFIINRATDRLLLFILSFFNISLMLGRVLISKFMYDLMPQYQNLEIPYAIILMSSGIISCWTYSGALNAGFKAIVLLQIILILIGLTTVLINYPQTVSTDPCIAIASIIKSSDMPVDLVEFDWLVDAQMTSLFLGSESNVKCLIREPLNNSIELDEITTRRLRHPFTEFIRFRDNWPNPTRKVIIHKGNSIETFDLKVVSKRFQLK
jgi:hypothetical protein